MLISDIPNVGELIKDAAVSNFYKIMIYMSTGIYNMIIWLYAVFINIAKARFVTNSVIQDLTSRLYLLIGIISLFLVAYSFLMVIVNPDNLTKGKYATTAMIKNIILAVVTITFVPTIFNFSYAVQKSILDKDVIGKIILDKGSGAVNAGEDSLADLSISIFETTFYLSGDVNTLNPNYVQKYDSCAAISKTYGTVNGFAGCTDLISSGAVEYNPLLSILIGLFVIYVLGIYCIDMGLRTIKLVFLQIIAPIPCLLMVVPDQDKVFKKWIQEVLKTFMEVFIKIFILTIGVYMIQLVTNVFTNYSDEVFGTMKSNSVIIFTKLFIIFGILMFVNKAPKLISDIFGIDLGYGLSLKKRMDDVKSGFKTLTTPFRTVGRGLNRVIGAGIGIGLSQAARVNANKAANKKSTKLQTGLSLFNGARNGWNGGIAHSGSAYRYQQLMERSYALDSAKGKGARFWGTVDAQARNIIGRDSRYDDLVMRESIKRDSENALLNTQIKEINDETGRAYRAIEKDHRDTLEANQQAADSAASIVTAVEGHTDKEDSNIKISYQKMYDNTHAKLVQDKKDAWDEAMSTTDAAKRASLIEKSNRIQTDIENLEKARKEITSSTRTVTEDQVDAFGQVIGQTQRTVVDFKDESFNRFAMDARIDAIKKMKPDEMSQDVKDGLILMFQNAKGMANEEYIKDKASWDADVSAAYADFKAKLKDSDAGNTVIYESVTDPVTGQTRSEKRTIDSGIKLNIQQKLDVDGDYSVLLKAKKQFKKLVDEETQYKNEQLSTKPIEIYLTDRDASGNIIKKLVDNKTLLEWNQEKAKKEKEVKDNNLEFEKFKESHEDENQSNSAKKDARSAAQKPNKK